MLYNNLIKMVDNQCYLDKGSMGLCPTFRMMLILCMYGQPDVPALYIIVNMDGSVTADIMVLTF